MKKFLLIMCVCAILLAGTSCKSKKIDTPDNTDVTGEVTGEVTGNVAGDISGDDTEPRETIDIDGDGVSDGYVIQYDSEGNVINEADETTPTVIVSDGGSDEGLWPSDSVPSDIPAYEEYEEMYPVQYTESDSSEEWYLSFDSSEKDYEDWLEKLTQEGYTESDKIVGFWGNGEQILNLYTEEIDGEFCVSIDIFKSKPVEYPKAVSDVFPEFTHTDSTLYGWYVNEGTPNVLSVSYACGKSFATDLNAYKQKLVDAGFTVTDDCATKDVDGKTYTVRYGEAVSRYEDSLEFEY